MATFKIDPNLEQAILKNPKLRNTLEQQVKRIEGAAIPLAPVLSGDLRKGIDSDVVVQNGKLVGRVVSKDFKSGWILFGTIKRRPNQFLQKAAESLGYKVRARRD